MITSMHIENFKCFKEFDIELGPFNVLIGPNDTGKTAFLQAIKLAGFARPGESPTIASVGEVSNKVGFDLSGSFWQGNRDNPICFHVGAQLPPDVTDDVKLVIDCGKHGELNPEAIRWASHLHSASSERSPQADAEITKALAKKVLAVFGACLCDSVYYNLGPRQLRRPCKHTAVLSDIGEGLPALLESILRADRERFLALEKHFYRRFPSYSRLELPLATIQRGADGIGLSFQTRQGKLLTADSVSDGVMLSLAFLAITYQLLPPRVLLIEEPETGVHHASLKDIVETLKQLSADKGVQVIMTTHSPYMLDGVDPVVVHVFQKDDEGAVHAKRLSDFDGAGEISDMFSTGEKWSLLAEKYGI